MKARLREYQGFGVDRTGILNAGSLVYIVDEINGNTIGDILRAAQDAAPASIEYLMRGEAKLGEMPRGANMCTVTVDYTPWSARLPDARGKRKSGDEKWTYEASTGNYTATEALSTIATVVASAKYQPIANSVKRQIGWNGKFGADSKCDGVGVNSRVLQIRCRKTYPAATAQAFTFMRTINANMNKVNNATFGVWGAGQVLFTGASIGEEYYNDDGDLLADVSYTFGMQPNQTAQMIDGLQFPAKEGWDYAWTIQLLDAATGEKVTAVGAISRVYRRTNLASELGIG